MLTSAGAWVPLSARPMCPPPSTVTLSQPLNFTVQHLQDRVGFLRRSEQINEVKREHGGGKGTGGAGGQSVG